VWARFVFLGDFMTEELHGPQHQDDLIPDEQLSPEARQRKEWRLKRRGYRAKEKPQKVAKAKAEAEQANEAKSFSEYWLQQRANLTPEQRTEYEAREDEVSLLEWLIARHLDGTYESIADQEDITAEERVTLSQLISAVQEDVALHGQVEMVALAVDKLWTEDQKSLREAASKGATEILIRYGYLVAISTRAYQDFSERFLVKRTPIPQYWTEIRCGCGAIDHVQKSTADDYRRTDFKYLCARCREAERRSAAQSNISVFQKTREDRVEPFDRWGRVKL
jgi:hypothetical protein